MQKQQLHRSELALMLDRQLKTLDEKGLIMPDAAEKLFEKLPQQMELPPDRLALLLVVPFSIIPFVTQLSSIRLKPDSAKKSYTFLKVEDIEDRYKTPEQPYLLCDVDDGRMMLGESPDSAGRKLMSQGRFPFTVNHGTALLLQQPESILHHNIHLTGSRIKDQESPTMLYTPDFYAYSGIVKMKRDSMLDADDRWGTASYGSVIEL